MSSSSTARASPSGSGAQVNVGGLVASTLAISDADFLDGLATGRYRFDGATGASQVRNDADLQAGPVASRWWGRS